MGQRPNIYCYKSQSHRRALFLSLRWVIILCLYADGHDLLGMEKKDLRIFVILKRIVSVLNSILEVVDVESEVFSIAPRFREPL